MKLAANVKLPAITVITVISSIALKYSDKLAPKDTTIPQGYNVSQRYNNMHSDSDVLRMLSHLSSNGDEDGLHPFEGKPEWVFMPEWVQSLRFLNSESAIVESSIGASVAFDTRVNKDVEALVELGSRVAGTPTNAKALSYLRSEYQKAGYETEVQTFTYPKFEDRGSNLEIDGNTIAGRALNGSPSGSSSATIAIVPNLGRKEDFQQVDVKGKIAVVRRGEIRFSDKASNAEAAGALGLVIVNNGSGNFTGTLGRKISIPVLSVSGEQGKPLLQNADNSQQIKIEVDTVRRLVTGRNLTARQADSTRPKVIIGGHYDSVSGSPGANDNASGTAIVLELARRLAGTPEADRVWFVAFDGEEDGLHGSRAFVDRASPQFLSQLSGMINFDMVGINKRLRVGGTLSLAAPIEKDYSVSQIGAIGGSDHIPFANAKVPVLFFTRGLDPNYHSPGDLKVNPRLLDETVEVGLEVTRQILK